jgi:hypothetical protein
METVEEAANMVTIVVALVSRPQNVRTVVWHFGTQGSM